MDTAQALTRDGRPWTPQYLESIDHKTCIGCGRCLKVCGHGVLKLAYLTEEGEIVEEDDGDAERMTVTLFDGGLCVGCGACARVCASKAQTHVSP